VDKKILSGEKGDKIKSLVLDKGGGGEEESTENNSGVTISRLGKKGK